MNRQSISLTVYYRYRGNIQLYDFLGEQKTQGVHDICLSTYDEPEQYSYNIRLAVPYDQLWYQTQ